ncbi:MAG: hypothetical protein IJX70_04330 [Clostridia bacterium]|nr:hypothetical protein [Clostridia bacterium]
MKHIRIVALIVVILVLVLCACTPKEEEVPSPISYIQQTLYTGGNNNFLVNMSSGRSEELFVADGKVGEVHDFVLISVVPLHVDLFNYSYTYILKGEKGEKTGELIKDSFGAGFSAEIEEIESVGKPISLVLCYQEKEEDITIENKLESMINGVEAIEIAENTLKESLERDGKEREIYVKYINDSSNPESPYYWYVAYIASPADYYSVLISPTDGNVVSVNP